jgi:hypothetical protein
VKLLNSEETAKSRIRSIIWDFLNTNKWKDIDDFSLALTNKFYDMLRQHDLSPESLLRIFNGIKTVFFRANKISKKQFADLLISDVGKQLMTIVAEGYTTILTISEIFPRMNSISDTLAGKSIGMIQGKEKFLQDGLRNILRKQGASPIPRREKDTAQEIADVEFFRVKLQNRLYTLSIVAKGFKSISGKTLTWEDVAHQVARAYQRGTPDHIILASAKEPTDGLITNLEEYSQTVGRPGLVIFVPPMDLTKILLAYGQRSSEQEN